MRPIFLLPLLLTWWADFLSRIFLIQSLRQVLLTLPRREGPERKKACVRMKLIWAFHVDTFNLIFISHLHNQKISSIKQGEASSEKLEYSAWKLFLLQEAVLCFGGFESETFLKPGLFVGRSVRWFVCSLVHRSVCHNFHKGRKVSLQCSYWSTFNRVVMDAYYVQRYCTKPVSWCNSDKKR